MLLLYTLCFLCLFPKCFAEDYDDSSADGVTDDDNYNSECEFTSDSDDKWTITTLKEGRKCIHIFASSSLQSPVAKGDCINDSITVFDGPTEDSTPLGIYCRLNDPHPTESSGNSMKTDKEETNLGFTENSPCGPKNSQDGLENSPCGPKNSQDGLENSPCGPKNSQGGLENSQGGQKNSECGSLAAPWTLFVLSMVIIAGLVVYIVLQHRQRLSASAEQQQNSFTDSGAVPYASFNRETKAKSEPSRNLSVRSSGANAAPDEMEIIENPQYGFA